MYKWTWIVQRNAKSSVLLCRGGRPSPTVSPGQLAQGGEKMAAVREPRASYTGAYTPSSTSSRPHYLARSRCTTRGTAYNAEPARRALWVRLRRSEHFHTTLPVMYLRIYVVAQPAGMRHVVFFSRRYETRVRISLVDRPDASSISENTRAKQFCENKIFKRKDARRFTTRREPRLMRTGKVYRSSQTARHHITSKPQSK